jgi:hypothetical protein
MIKGSRQPSICVDERAGVLRGADSREGSQVSGVGRRRVELELPPEQLPGSLGSWQPR